MWQLCRVAGTWTFVFLMAIVDFADEEELMSRGIMKY